jgi:hypothetical protein
VYICEICEKTIPPHTKAIRLPAETRTRQYPSRQKEVSAGRGKRRTITVPGGVGFEIVREIVACPDCAAKYADQKQTSATV